MPGSKSVSAIPARRKCISWRRWTASRAWAVSCACRKGVAAGAADGYARMTGRPAATLLHLGPGFAKCGVLPAQCPQGRAGDRQYRGRSRHQPCAIWAGAADQRYPGHLRACFRTGCTGAAPRPTLRAMAPRAVQAARQGQIATLVLPADCAWNDADGPVPPLAGHRAQDRGCRDIAQIAAALGNGKTQRAAVARTLSGAFSLDAAGRIARATGARCSTIISPRASPAAPACRGWNAFPISRKRF